jgi:hypothetical protein
MKVPKTLSPDAEYVAEIPVGGGPPEMMMGVMQVRRDDQPAQDARQPVGQAQGGMGKDIGHVSAIWRRTGISVEAPQMNTRRIRKPLRMKVSPGCSRVVVVDVDRQVGMMKQVEAPE